MTDLANKVIILTGASSGIGAYTAQYLSQYKPRLVVVARRKDKLDEVASKCIAKGLPKENLFVLPADLSKLDDLKRIVTDTVNRFGQIDVLVNNAAAMAGISGIEGFKPEDFDTVITANLKAPIFLSQAAVPHLKRTKDTIINISNTASVQPTPIFTMYGASKAGLDHFTESLALELAPFDVLVNSIRPGFIMTENMQKAPPFIQEKMKIQAKESQPLKGVGECEDVAKVIKFLASDDASFVTGENIFVDGGRHLIGPVVKMEGHQ